MQAARHGGIVAAQVLALVRPRQIGRRQGLEADEEASQAGGGGALDQIALKNGIHCGGALEQAPHPAHAIEQRGREAAIAEQVIVEEVEVAARQPRDLGERIVDALRVEGAAACEERVLVAEVAVLGTASRDDDRVRYQVRAAVDQIAANGREAIECPP